MVLMLVMMLLLTGEGVGGVGGGSSGCKSVSVQVLVLVNEFCNIPAPPLSPSQRFGLKCQSEKTSPASL